MHREELLKIWKAVGPCPVCHETEHWLNNIPLTAYCDGPDNKPHRTICKIVPNSLNPYEGAPEKTKWFYEEYSPEGKDYLNQLNTIRRISVELLNDNTPVSKKLATMSAGERKQYLFECQSVMNFVDRKSEEYENLY